MDITYKDVKEISLVTHYVFYGYDENAYTDLLRVSNGWVSYKRTNFHTKKEVCSWSYKSSSWDLKSKFEQLIDTFYHEYHAPHEAVHITDCGSFNVRVTFKDDTYVDFSRDGNFYMNGLDNQARAFMRLIPVGEPYPDFLNENSFVKEELTRELLQEIDKTKLVALMYAEGGAMGMPGHIEIVDDDNVRYVAETLYVENPKVTQFEVTALFDGFEHVEGFASGEFDWKQLNGECWLYLNLGAGNHLYIRKDFYHKYGSRILAARDVERYRNWMKLIKEEI